jgi:hypothetical protein
MRAVLAVFVFVFLLLAMTPARTWFYGVPVAETTHQHTFVHRHNAQHGVHARRAASTSAHAHTQRRYAGGRPAQWCGWFMRQVFGEADRAFNLAIAWARWGRKSEGPQVGAVVVWRHHVGLIAGGPDQRGRWLVRSGNDAHAVRTRYLSLRGAVAFRLPDR